jgi:anti-anti-sigma regulatory factor
MTLKITEVENIRDRKLLQLEGKLTNGDARILERTLGKIGDEEHITVDLSGVTFIDRDGAAIVMQLKQKGVDLVGLNFFIKAVLDAHNERNK